MSRRIAVIACLCLISSFAAPVLGKDLQLAASGKWDLWEDPAGSSPPDREKVETPAQKQAETQSSSIQEPSGKDEVAKGDDVKPVEPGAEHRPETRAPQAVPVPKQKAEIAQSPASGGKPSITDDAHQPDAKTVQSATVPQQAVKSEIKEAETNRPVNIVTPGQPANFVSVESAAGTKEAAPAAVNPPVSVGTVPAAVDAEYIIGPGDFLDISVWKDEVLSRTVVVLADGTISFPLIGKVQAAGRTIAQVKDEIVRKLVRYYPEPEVNMEVKQSNSMLIYVIGRVNAPGRQVLNANIDVIQALAMAGGLNPFASRNKIKVLRKDGGKTVVLPFRYDDVIDGKIATNIELKRGDVIVVP